MVWYLLRSTGSFRAASSRAAASEIGVPLGLAALSCLSAPLPCAVQPCLKARQKSRGIEQRRALGIAFRLLAGWRHRENAGAALVARIRLPHPHGSICEYSATRRVRVENSIALRKAISLRASGSCTARSSSGTSRSTLSSSSTSCREIRAFSAFSISASRRFGCLISPARNSNCSRSPYSMINCAAVLTPMPGTPGTLSVESPASACTSTTFSGGTPNFSITSGMPMRRSFMVSYMVTCRSRAASDPCRRKRWWWWRRARRRCRA